MQESKRESDEIFRQLDRMRRAWEHVNPSKRLNKSQFSTLLALARLSGRQKACGAGEPAAQSKGAKTANGAKASNSEAAASGAADRRARCRGQTSGERQAANAVTLSELAAAMHQSLPALSQRVTVLEEKGFVERVANPADRRVTGLRLTQAGHGEMDAAFRRFGGILSQAAGRVGKQKMRLLLQLLGELADALNEAAQEADREQDAPDGSGHENAVKTAVRDTQKQG